MADLRTDPTRSLLEGDTGIYVRARSDGKWDSVDLAQLDARSLLDWLHGGLRGNPGCNPLAENVVLILLGHRVRHVDLDGGAHADDE